MMMINLYPTRLYVCPRKDYIIHHVICRCYCSETALQAPLHWCVFSRVFFSWGQEQSVRPVGIRSNLKASAGRMHDIRYGIVRLACVTCAGVQEGPYYRRETLCLSVFKRRVTCTLNWGCNHEGLLLNWGNYTL